MHPYRPKKNSSKNLLRDQLLIIELFHLRYLNFFQCAISYLDFLGVRLFSILNHYCEGLSGDPGPWISLSTLFFAAGVFYYSRK
jgi:hypothetical protein